jgi:uncharacterized protein YqcC (DUF446 family)
MKPGYAIVQKKIDAIEAKMKRIGYWQSEPLDPGQYGFQRAFAMDTMTFSQWLQFIFIPRVKEIVAIAFSLQIEILRRYAPHAVSQP